MPGARAAVRVREDSALREHPFVNQASEPIAWLDVGDDGELSVYGSPAAMRRLGESVLVVADATEEMFGPPRAAATG